MEYEKPRLEQITIGEFSAGITHEVEGDIEANDKAWVALGSNRYWCSLKDLSDIAHNLQDLRRAALNRIEENKGADQPAD